LLLASLTLTACGSLLGIEEVSYDATIDTPSAGSGGGGAGGSAGAGGGSGGDAGVGGDAGASGDAGAGGTGGAGGDGGSAGDGGAGTGGDAGTGGVAGVAGQGGDAGAAGAAGQGGNGGAAGASGQGGDAGAAGQGTGPCENEGKAIFVAPTGQDGAPGTRGAPKQTLKNAVDTAQTTGKVEVCLCKGTYPESSGVRLDKPISLRGGFDCGTWKRLPEALTDKLQNETILVTDKGSQASEGAALYFTGGAVTAATVVEGLTIRRGDSAENGPQALGSAAVRVGEEASPTIQRCSIEGGNGSGNGKFVSGLLVTEGSAPTVRENRIVGGGGTASGIGVRIVMNKASGAYERNLVMGGTGTVECTVPGGEGAGTEIPWASAGFWVTGSGPLTLKDNQIHGGSGKRTQGCPRSLAGVALQQKGGLLDATLEGNVIDAGSSDAGGRMTGVFAALSGQLLASGNRIYGGSLDSDNMEASTAGLWIEAGNAPQLTLMNGMIHGGNGTKKKAAGSTAVALQGGSGKILHNTLFAGGQAAGATESSAVTALHVGASTTDVFLERNYIQAPVAAAGVSRSLYMERCADELKSAVTNLFANGSTVLQFSPDKNSCYKGKSSPVLDAATAQELVAPGCSNPGCKAFEMALLADTCATPGPSCVIFPCATSGDATNCQDSLFANWSPADTGRGALVGAAPTPSSPLMPEKKGLGWRLDSAGGPLPCPLVQAKPKLSPGLEAPTADLFGTPRTGDFSPGAEEIDGSCKGPTGG
jgi:hypothetical protein